MTKWGTYKWRKNTAQEQRGNKALLNILLKKASFFGSNKGSGERIMIVIYIIPTLRALLHSIGGSVLS